MKRVIPSIGGLLFLAMPVYAQVNISPGTNIQSVINRNPSGTTYTLLAGTHREQTIRPKSGDTFQGEMIGSTRLTILSGARQLTSWTADNGRWYTTGQSQAGTVGSPKDCLVSHPRCIYAEDLFFDNVMKFHESSLASTGTGEWFFDYATDRIYVGDDPNGHVVETSVTTQVFIASPADNVTIKDMIVEKYASTSGGGSSAVNLGYSPLRGDGWLATNLEVRYNHFAGIGNDTATSSTNNYVHHNCNSGFVGAGINVVISGNEIAYNGIAPGSSSTPCGFDPYWGAGGSKWVYTTNLAVSNNFAHHNYGAGLWTDINNVGTLYENNRVEFNFRSGIFHEISFAATIRYNTLTGNGQDTRYGDWPTNGCIEIVSSPNVEVYWNTCIDNGNGIIALDDPRDTGDIPGSSREPDSLDIVNLYVHHNVIYQQGSESGFQGMINYVDDTPSGAAFQQGANNRWTNNTYCLVGGKDPYFRWAGADRTNEQWIALGMDANNAFRVCSQ